MAGKPGARASADEFLRDLLPYLLQRASFLVTREFHRTLALNQVPVSRWRLLAWLAEHQPFSIGELTEQLMLKQPTVTKLVNDAERDGLVRKSTDPTDKRRLVISLTPVGRRLALRLMAEARKAEDRTTDNIGQQEITRLKARLKKLIDDFDPSDGGAI